jgi:DNA polymerase-3 subunit chi
VSATEHWFYHLEGQGPQNALPPLLEKVLQRGWRAMVRSTDAAALMALDKHLWTHRPDSFLPHGLSTEPRAETQPILLTQSADNENNAQIIILLHGAEMPALDGVERCITMFDGADQNALTQARERWKAARAEEATASYWRQDAGGRWSKQG